MKAIFVFLLFQILAIEPALAVYRLKLEGLGFLAEPLTPVAQYEGRVEAEYERNLKLSRTLTFKFHPFVRATSVPKAWNAPVFFDLREMNLTLNLKPFFFRAGFFTLNWEGTDVLNPMDITTMKNYGDPFAPLTKSAAGLQMGTSGEVVNLEAAWIPKQTFSDLPGEESAWLPRQLSFPLQTDEIELRLPDTVGYKYLPRENIDKPRDNNFAARIQLRHSLGDLALGYYDGVAENPILQPTLDVTPIQVSPKEIYLLQSPVKITAIDYRRKTGAAAITVPLGEWIIRAASRYDQPSGDDERLPSWSNQTVAGIERSFYVGDNQITTIAQYVWYHKPESLGLMSISEIFDRSVLLGVRAPIGEDWTILLGAMLNTVDQSQFFQGQVTYRLSDALQAETYLQLLDGPDDSVMGTYSRNDRAGIRLSFVF